MGYYIDLYAETLSLFYSSLFAKWPVLVFIWIASRHDIETKKIPNELNRFFLILRFLVIPWYPISMGNIYGMAIGFLIILLPAMIMMKPMGGDIKFLAVLGLWTNDAVILSSILIGIVFFVFYAKMNEYAKDDMIPFGPFVSLGYLSLSILYLINF